MHRLGVMWIALCVLVAGCGDDNDRVVTPTPRPSATATAAPSNTAAPSGTPTASPSAPPTTTNTAPPTATATASPTATQSVPNPVVEGPITGPGNPFVQGTNFDPADVGYARDEYFLSGTARGYVNVGELTPDGVWGVEAGTSAAYKTRILIYRPIDAERFNGSVVVEWLNVSAGFDTAPDWISAHTELVRGGYVWVGVSAQLVGIEGSGGGPIPGLPDLSLKSVGPVRYASLHHPGDTFSYDMFSQVGQALRSPVGIDPLGGLPVERLIAAGESQSAFRLTTYVNGVHPVANIYDGFLIHSRGASGAPLSQMPQADIRSPFPTRIRSDLDVPVLTLQTETDLITLNFLPDRQEDGPLFRLWEVAGTAHADLYTLLNGFNDIGGDPTIAVVREVAEPIPPFVVCTRPVNSGPSHFVLRTAFDALNRWIRDGEAPPTAPRLEVTGQPPVFVLDEYGNVRGGIRTPYVDVPVAALSGLGQTGSAFCGLFGTTMFLDSATLATLYPTPEDYVEAVSASTDEAIEAGFILPYDGDLIKEAAALQFAD